MKKKHRDYIRSVFPAKSARQIAQELGLKERKVKEFLASIADGGSSGGKKALTAVRPPAFSSADWSIAAGVVLVAFIVRMIYLFQVKNAPFFVPFRNGLDDFLYDAWAQEIASGKVLGSEAFYGLPLYPYVLGLIYFLFGRSVMIAKGIQFLCGSFSCGLVYLIGRRVFGRVSGAIGAALCVFYGMAIFFEGFFVSAFLAVLLNCLLLILLLRLLDTPSVGGWGSAGILLGLSALANASSFLFMALIIPWTMYAYRDRPAVRRAACIGIFLLGVAAVIAPVAIRNRVIAHDNVLITAHSGLTFYAGNNPRCEGAFNLPRDLGTSVVDTRRNAQIIAERHAGRALKPSEISRFWSDQAYAFIRSDPAAFIRLEVKKALLFWNAHEIPDVLPYAFFKQFAPLLRLPLVSFGLIGPLALLGMVLTLKARRADIALLSLFVLSVYASTIIYFVNSRYQLAALPALAAFAGMAVCWCAAAVREKRNRALAAAGGFLVLVALISHIRMLDFRMEQAYNNLGIIFKRQGLYEQAIEQYRKAIGINPQYDTPHFNLGLLYADRGDTGAAIVSFNEALKRNPVFIKAHNKVALLYIKTGDKEKALEHLQESLRLDPGQEDMRQLYEEYRRSGKKE